jgi:hypothetical protein
MLFAPPDRAGARLARRSFHWLACLTAALVTLLCAPSATAQGSTPLQVLHPTGEADDAFGYAVAIDGDTMIVGAYNDSALVSQQGSALVYRWTGTGWAFEATLLASDGASDSFFGVSVALSGDTAVIGASNGVVGSAYVFVRSGTSWSQQAKLTDTAPDEGFGISVSVSGDTTVVGAEQGAAYVFVRSGTTWTQQARLAASDGQPGDFFGYSVALSGDTAVVGAFESGGAQGSAYVFVRSGTAWSQQAELFASDGGPGQLFGRFVALAGDTALVGAPYAGDITQGSAYVFARSGATWTQQAQLTPSDGATGDSFGVAVGISCNSVIVGSSPLATSEGAAYIFASSGAAWTEQAKLTAPDGQPGDYFGYSVALSGDTAVVGAFDDNVGANPGQGSAWVFSRIGGTWITQGLRVLATGGAAGDQFGGSVALSDDTAVVGANDRGAAQGAAYIFVRSGSIWTQQAELTADDGAPGDNFGSSVALSGDTVLVGAVTAAVGANASQGAVYVFTRSGTDWTQQAKLTAPDGAAGDAFGAGVALSGDLAIVGAPNGEVGSHAQQGAAYVFALGGGGWTLQAKLSASDGAAFDSFGSAVALSEDTALVGANGDTVGAHTQQGSAYVFTRSGVFWTQQAKLTASDGATEDFFGGSVALSGDTALVGANHGFAYTFFRSGTTWTQQSKLTVPGSSPDDAFAISVALSGDTALIGQPNEDGGAGSAYVFTRSNATWTQQARLVATPGNLGVSVALSGDAALVGAPGTDFGLRIAQGAAWFYSVPFNDFSGAQNNATNVDYPTLAAALLPAQSGQQITATQAAWRTITNLDTAGRSLILWSGAALRTPSTSTITLGGSSSLNVAPGSSIDIFGQLRVSSVASADLFADHFSLGSRAIMTARTGSSLTIDAPAWLEGQTRLEQGASLTFGGAATTIGPITAALNSSIIAGDTLTNMDTFTVTAGTINTALFWNRARADVFGSSAVYGDYTNEVGATTTIRSGSLYIFGSLTNNGTVVGTICSNCLATPPNLDVGGSLILGPAANLTMPFGGSLVHLGGSFDCAINSNTRFDLSLATLQMEGSAAATLEVMSTDIGPLPGGLDRTLAGHYPIGVLHIGPSPSTVQLVDNHDNDNLGQGACEALYVNQLIIDAGCRLINTTCRVYYSTLVNNGSVDVPANLVRIAHCGSADFNCDGDLGTDADIASFFACLAGTCPPPPCTSSADFNGDGDIGTDSDIEAFFRVLGGGNC